MDKLRNVFSISCYNLKKWCVNPRIYLVFLMIFLYLFSILSPVVTFCLRVGHPVTPYVFPYIMSSPNNVLLIMLGVVLVFCDAPFIEIDQPYIILRSGRTLWTVGHLMYIVIASFVYFLLIVLFTVLILTPCLELSAGWGKVIGTFTQTAAALQHQIVIPFEFSIYNAYTPLAAMAVSFLNCWLVASALGLLMFVLNLNFSRVAGVLAASLLIFWQLASTKTWTGFSKFSPVSWVSLARIDTTGTTLYPTLGYVYTALALMFILLSVACVRSMRRRDIDVLKSV